MALLFRYPGAKNKLLASIWAYLNPMLIGKLEFHDVFVGGGSVLCEVARCHPKIRLFANDLDANMAAFWRLVARPWGVDHEGFVGLIKQVPTIELFNKLRSQNPKSDVEKAYHAVFFNRTTFSGIATAGPIGGLQQADRGEGRTYTVDCRYNPVVIERDFRTMVQLMSGRLTVGEDHVSNYLLKNHSNLGAFYLDPPYFKKGKDLYSVFMQDWEHENLALLLHDKRKDANWILSYDICDEIDQFYSWARCHRIAARYSIDGAKKVGSGWKKKEEFLIVSRSAIPAEELMLPLELR